MGDPDMDTPAELELRPSQLDPSTIGVYCKRGIRQGARFGPLLGERLQEIPKNTNPEYLLKVVDKDSKELVFYVDASDTNTSNWMRCIQGCRSAKGQNVMPQRDGSDIYLTATKDLSKGSELQVLFEETAKATKGPAAKDGAIKTILICWGEDNLTPKSKSEKQKKNQSNKKLEEEERKDEEDKEEEMETEEESKTGDEEDDDDSSSVKEEGKYQFELKTQHTIKSRLGRKVFQCDICSGVYRHAFSLKRHYIRNHINYKYVSKADLLNCQINLEANYEPNVKGVTVNSGTTENEANAKKDDKQCDKPGDNQGDNKSSKPQCDKQDTDSRSNDKSDLKECPSNGGSDKENSDSSQGPHESNIDKKAEKSSADSPPSNVNSLTNNDSFIRFPGLYRCNVCGHLFDTIVLLKSHVSHHPDIPNLKAFSCDSCDMKFTHKQNLMRHQAVHTGAKPYLCKFCGKKFPTATNQKRHERIHLGRRISCDFCSSSFTQSGDLKKHIRKLHPECFHECAFCGKYFSSEKSLEEHLLTHEETVISNLEEATRRRHAFKVNMEQDMAESMRLAEQRPGFKYACTVCKKRFHDYANMCRHRRLAHQRHLLISKRNGKLEEEEVLPVQDVSDDQAELDPHSYFFANVARNIAENLKYFVDGGHDNLNNPDMHIKWKVSDDHDEEATKSPVNQAPSNSECSNYSVYNFPKGFEPKSNFHKQIDHEDELLKTETSNNTTNNSKSNQAITSQANSSTNSTPKLLTSTPAFVLSVPSFHVNKSKDNVVEIGNTTGVTAKVTEAPVIKQEPIEVKSVDSPQDKSSSDSPLGSKHSSPVALDLKKSAGRKSPKSPAPKSPAAKSDAVDKIDTKRSNSPISVPKVKICSICHCIFHRADSYLAHMRSRHKVDVNADEQQSQNQPPMSLPSTVVSTNQITSPTLSSPPTTPLKSPSIPFASYQAKSWDGSVAAIDLSNSSEAQMYDFNGALDLTSPTKTSPPTSVLDYQISPPGSVDVPNKHLQFGDINSTAKYTCGVCHEDYPGLDALQTHQRTSHANESRDQLNVIGDFNSNWALKPNPIGLLNVCTSQIPTAEDYAAANVKYTCTKCKAEFVQIGDLHNHIVECAVDRLAVSARPHLPKSRLKFAKGLGWVSSRHNYSIMESKAKANHQVKKKVKRALLKTIMTRQTEIDEESGLPRRRSLELLYNPSKHVRRREMTEVLDMHRCRGCGFRFATISLLERHIKVCTQKDRIKELQVMKPTLRGASSMNSLNKRHMCHYCQKNFTYIGGLKKHIFTICSVRKHIKKENGKLDQDWEDSIVAMLLARDAAQEEENYEKATRKRRGRRKNHRWGYGKKKKSADADANDAADGEAGDGDQEKDEEDDDDENYDDESVASLVSKDSVRTDTSNSNVNNDNMDDENFNDDNNDNDDDDDDSTSGALVIDIKEEEEEKKSIDFRTEGLQHQINGKVSPGVIRAHVEHLQHKDSVKIPSQFHNSKLIIKDVSPVKPEQKLEASKVLDLTPPKKSESGVSIAVVNDVQNRKSSMEEGLLDSCSKTMAARALIDLQSSAETPSSPAKPTTFSYSGLKIPDLSGRSFRLPASKQPKKAKTNADPKSPKLKSPTKQKVSAQEEASKSLNTQKEAPSPTKGKPGPKPKSMGLTNTEPNKNSPAPSPTKGKKEASKRKAEDEVVNIPVKKTLTRSKSKNAGGEGSINQEPPNQTGAPIIIGVNKEENTSVNGKTATTAIDNSAIRIKTGSKVKAVTLTSPRVTSAAMKLIVPSPARMTSVKQTATTLTKAKVFGKQVTPAPSPGVQSKTTAKKEKVTTNAKDKQPPSTPAKDKEKATPAASKPAATKSATSKPVATKPAGKRGPKSTKDDKEDNVKDTKDSNINQEVDKKPAKKGPKGRGTATRGNAEKATETKPGPKKTTKRSNSANVTPDPTPPPSPAKKNPKRRATRAS